MNTIKVKVIEQDATTGGQWAYWGYLDGKIVFSGSVYFSQADNLKCAKDRIVFEIERCHGFESNQWEFIN